MCPEEVWVVGALLMLDSAEIEERVREQSEDSRNSSYTRGPQRGQSSGSA